MLRAYGFEWQAKNPLGSGAVVVAGNVQGARNLLVRSMLARGIDELYGYQAWTTSPGPYWTKKAKTLKKAKVLYFRHNGSGNDLVKKPDSIEEALLECRKWKLSDDELNRLLD